MSKKIIYEFDGKTLFGITHPGLETGFINEVNKWLRAKSQVLAHGFVLVKCKNLEELIYLLTKIRTPLMFGIPIFVCELEKVTESEILSCIKEAHQTFENFINNHNLEGLSIAFRGIRRSFRWLEKQVFKHDFTSVRLAKITADELLKSYSFVFTDLFRSAVSIDFTKMEINSPHLFSKYSTFCWDFAILSR